MFRGFQRNKGDVPQDEDIKEGCTSEAYTRNDRFDFFFLFICTEGDVEKNRIITITKVHNTSVAYVQMGSIIGLKEMILVLKALIS